MAWVSVCELEELVGGEPRYVEIDGFRLVAYADGGELFALDDLCPHAKGSLSKGWLDRGCAVCPLHAWAFDLKTGEARGIPGVRVRTYPVRLRQMDDGRQLVQVDLPAY